MSPAKRRRRPGARGATTAALDRLSREASADHRYVLRLYVTGMTPRSITAVANIRSLCEERLQGRYDLEVVDIYQNPGAGRDEQLVAAPTLIKRLPLPLRRLVGDLSDRERVLVGLDLVPKERS